MHSSSSLLRALPRALLPVLFAATCHGGEGISLETVQNDITKRYDVHEVEPESLAATLASSPDLHLLLDVRSPEEYAVSHLAGAIRVDGRLSARRFVERHRAALEGREVVLYCSVGVRSARLGERVQTAARAAGAKSVRNLRGGIFRWRNEERPLVDALGVTRQVHPFSSRWGRLLDDPSAASQEVRNTQP